MLGNRSKLLKKNRKSFMIVSQLECHIVLVSMYMPHDTTGRDRKLARPYHGPYRIVSVTPTNAEVKLIDRVEEPSIFVAVSRLRRCYPEQPDASWTGRRKSKRPRRTCTRRLGVPPCSPAVQRTPGPVTRSMAKKSKPNVKRATDDILCCCSY